MSSMLHISSSPSEHVEGATVEPTAEFAYRFYWPFPLLLYTYLVVYISLMSNQSRTTAGEGSRGVRVQVGLMIRQQW